MTKKKPILFIVALAILLIPLISSCCSAVEPSSAKLKTRQFLGNVIGVDLSKCVKLSDHSNISYPSTFGGLVKEEDESFEYRALDGSNIQGMAMYFNQYIANIFFRIYNSPIISEPYSANTLSTAKDIMAKYSIFAQAYDINSPSLNSAITMLDKVSALKTFETTSGNIKMKITNSTTDNIKSTEIAWIYTINGIEADSKRICLTVTTFDNVVQVSFVDTWGLYSVADIGISQNEATDIAFAAAHNYDFGIADKSSSNNLAKTVWAEATPTVYLSMVPGQVFNNSADAGFNPSGIVNRDPLTLYPLWHTIYYLRSSVTNAVGIQVAVWGDTRQVAYCTEYGYQSSDAFTSTETKTSIKSSAGLTTILDIPLTAAVIAFVMIPVLGAFALKRKR